MAKRNRLRRRPPLRESGRIRQKEPGIGQAAKKQKKKRIRRTGHLMQDAGSSSVFRPEEDFSHDSDRPDEELKGLEDTGGLDFDPDPGLQGTGKEDRKGPSRSRQQSRRYQRTKSRVYFDDDLSPGRRSGHADEAGSKVSGSRAAKVARRAAGEGILAASEAVREAAQPDTGSDEDEGILPLEQTGHLLIRTASGRPGSRKGQKSKALRDHGQSAVHDGNEKQGRLYFSSAEPKGVQADRSARGSRQQKKRLQKAYAQAFRTGAEGAAAQTSETAAQAVRRPLSGIIHTAVDYVRNHGAAAICCAVSGLILTAFITGVGTSASLLAESGGAFIESTYLSSDEAIREVDAFYEELEDGLQEQIDRMEQTHPGYDEYRYQIDEIDHDPFQLASYLTARYGAYTKSQVRRELREIFDLQYGLSTHGETVTETVTRTVRVGESLGRVVTSGYCNCAICCGRWAGGPTASGRYPRAQHTIAVDASDPFVPMGTHVVMNGHEYVVEDTGAFARYGVQFDVYYDSHSAASNHGHKTWEAYLVDSGGRRSVEVTETKRIRRLNVKLEGSSLDEIFRSRLNEDQRRQYGIYNMTYGNRDYLFPAASAQIPDGMSYSIPPEALSDRRFARMIREAEKYLGYPYVWGGSKPSTSFDCSGFVCWVVNHCGNGWDVGRTTAEGLRRKCTYVSPANARPGDLIFFKGTYNTSGASHIGIYVGNSMMIHCGSPIKYASIDTKYWKKHFWCFGRLR